MHNALFICNQNELRSPTAEKIFSGRPGLEVRSAGIRKTANVTLSVEMLEWADLVFVMDRKQRTHIHNKYAAITARKRIICLDIPDEYQYMDPVLVRLLQAKVTPHLDKLKPREK